MGLDFKGESETQESVQLLHTDIDKQLASNSNREFNDDFNRARESFARVPATLPEFEIIAGTEKTRFRQSADSTGVVVKDANNREWSLKLGISKQLTSFAGPDGVEWRQSKDGGWEGSKDGRVVGRAKDVDYQYSEDGKRLQVAIRGEKETVVHDSSTGLTYIDRRDGANPDRVGKGRGVVLVKDGDKVVAASINGHNYSIEKDGALKMYNGITKSYDVPVSRIKYDHKTEGFVAEGKNSTLALNKDGTITARAFRSEEDRLAGKPHAEVTTLPGGGRLIKTEDVLQMRDTTGRCFKAEKDGVVSVYKNATGEKLDQFKGTIDRTTGIVTTADGKRSYRPDGSVVEKLDGAKERITYPEQKYSLITQNGKVVQVDDDKGQCRYKISYDHNKTPRVTDPSGKKVPELSGAHSIRVGKSGDITATFESRSDRVVMHPDGAITNKTSNEVRTTLPDRTAIIGDLRGRIESVRNNADRETIKVKYAGNSNTIESVTINGQTYKQDTDTKIQINQKGEVTVHQQLGTNDKGDYPHRTITADRTGRETITYSERPQVVASMSEWNKPQITVTLKDGEVESVKDLRTGKTTTPGSGTRIEFDRATHHVAVNGHDVFKVTLKK